MKNYEELENEIRLLKLENQALKQSIKKFYDFRDVIEKVQIQEQTRILLEETENSYRQLFENMFSGFIICDLVTTNNNSFDFIFLYANKPFEKIFDISNGFIQGKTAQSVPDIINSLWIKRFAEVAIDRIGIEFTYYHEKTGKYIRIFAYSPKKMQFAAIFEDITIKTLEESKIKGDLSFTQNLIDAIPTPVFFKDATGRYLLCNKAYSQTVLGVSPHVILGKTALELEQYFPKELANIYQEKDDELLKTQKNQTYEGTIRCADLVTRQFIINKTLIKNPETGSIGILGAMHDIDNLLNTQKQLEQSEERYRTLFNGILHPIFVLDKKASILMANTKALQAIKKDITQITGKRINTIIKLNPNQIPDFSTEFVNNELTTRELKFLVNGKQRYYDTTFISLPNFLGQDVIQIIAYDITELKEYQQQLIESKTIAEEANRLKTIFLENLSHEIRTPMNAINGFSQLLKLGTSPENQRKYLDIIYSNSKKLLGIIDDIVEISMIEVNQIKVQRNLCSINSILEETYAIMLEEQNELSKLDIQFHKPELMNIENNLIYADSHRIGQVLRKLLRNAFTYTIEGCVNFGVKEVVGQTITFFVTDTGIGIQKEKHHIIFEQFRQGDEGIVRKFGGTGLGLSISRELVTKMGGEIWFDSEINKGSTFYFTIPFLKVNKK